MPELAPMRTVASKAAAVHVTAVNAKALLRLKSWLPEVMRGEKAIVLTGRELQSQVGASSSGSGAIRVMCIGPGDWLLVSHEHTPQRLREDIGRDVPSGLVLVDLTDGLAGLQVQGSAARELLSKGCGFDFHPRTFPAGQCARTRFAQIPVVLECLDEPPRFELYVARSYLAYLHSWLIDAAFEFEATVA